MSGRELGALREALLSGDSEEVRRISAEDSRRTREAAEKWSLKIREREPS